MYWTDYGVPGKIERASMDGTGRVVLHDAGLSQPNGIAVDIQLQRVYWIDAVEQIIEYSNVDGTGRTILETQANGLAQPFSLALLGDILFWNDWTNQSVFATHKINGDSILTIVNDTVYRPNGIVAVDVTVQPTGTDVVGSHQM